MRYKEKTHLLGTNFMPFYFCRTQTLSNVAGLPLNGNLTQNQKKSLPNVKGHWANSVNKNNIFIEHDVQYIFKKV